MLSVSALTSFSYCPRKYYLQYVLGLKVPFKKDFLVRGTIRHETEEHGIKGQESIVCRLDHNTMDQLSVLFKELYEKSLNDAFLRHAEELKETDWDPKELQESMRKQVLQQVQYRIDQILAFSKEHHLAGPKLWNALLPKIQTEVWVTAKSLGVRGIVDQIEDYKSHLLPVELKTGSLPREGVWPGHKIQVGTYMMMMNEALRPQQPIKRAVVRYLDHGVERDVVMNPFLEMEIKNLVQTCTDLKTAQELPPHIEHKNKCNSCQYKDVCFSEKDMNEAMEKKWGTNGKRNGDKQLTDFFS